MQTSALLNDFAIRCFRDVADQDYIAARLSYRARLIPQFHWSGLQAIEKYLKAILLFNRIKAKDVNHDLARALHYAKKLPFDLNLSTSSTELIDHLDTYGRFRYLESSFHVHGPKLVQLDKTVWEIRRYCRVLDYELKLSDGRSKRMLDLELTRIGNSEKSPPHQFQLQGGMLEKILEKKDHPARKALVWQNGFFGSSVRRRVRMVQHFHATNAPLTLHPEILEEVLKYVYLPKEVVVAYQEVLTKRSSGHA